MKKKGFFMSNIKQREKFDDYEMEDEYDFTDGVRGRFYEPKKIPVSLRLDNDIILFFKNKWLVVMQELIKFCLLSASVICLPSHLTDQSAGSVI